MGRICLRRKCLNKRAWLVLGFFIVLGSSAYSQDKTIADSLELVYATGSFEETERLTILEGLAAYEPDPEKALKYSEELLETAQELDSTRFIVEGFLHRGTSLRLKGDLSEALEDYFKAAEIAIDNKLNADIGKIHIAIADVYSIMGNHNNSVYYYLSAINILREVNDSMNLASALVNAGDEYFNYGELDSALIFFNESGAIFKAINSEIGVAYNLGNTGLVYAQMGRNEIAENDLNKAIQILTELGDYYPICVYLTYMSDIYIERGEELTAVNYAQRSLDLAKLYGLKDQISDAYLKLSELYEKMGKPIESIKHYKEHIIYKDSVNSITAVQEMADLRTNYEVSLKQGEVDLLEKESEISDLRARRQKFLIYGTGIILVMVALLAFGVLHRNKYIDKTNLIIEDEKSRSDSLLLNILPEETAQELKEHGKVKAKKIDSATVLFTDFKDFTKLAEHTDPEKMVTSIDFYFKKFDEITTKYSLEKIKTIGDSYMCAGGLHKSDQNHARDVIKAAKEMVELVDSELHADNDLIHFEVRIGVHTGPVVAGIVGIKKWQYDIWGDTVNIASRMESNSESGMINLSETTYNKIKDEFPCEYRGEIEVKNRGSMKMYFLS
jgi:class 3 adenylate cyclase/tetratricopeptide (TPR) repeat protein